MGIYTIQMSKYRTALALGAEVVDATVKSGEEFLAPTWDMVRQHKAGAINDDIYALQYANLMRASIALNTDKWKAIMDSARCSDIALMCYCRYPGFCHRHLLANMLTKLKINGEPSGLVYLGEITGAKTNPVILLDHDRRGYLL